MQRIALIKGPNLRDDGNVLVWEQLNRTSSYEVVAFASDPPRFDTSGIDIPVRRLPWPEGRYDLFGYEHFFSRAIAKARFPSDFLRGINPLVAEFDVLHANENFNGFSIQAALATRNTDTAFTFTAGENIPYPRFQHNPLLWQLKRLVNETADGITTTTRVGKRALIHEGVPHDQIEVVPNSVALESFRPNVRDSPSSVGLPESAREETVILFVHKLCEQKGTPYLLDAFEDIASTSEGLRLVLIGTNHLDTSTTARITQNEQISWLKRVPHEKMPALYGLSDVFVLPSVTMTNNEEQFGMGLLEAMACGLPAVVTDVGGLPYVADPGETALVVRERSTDELAGALERLVTDSDLCTHLGTAGRSRAIDVFAPDRVASRLKSFYDAVLA